MAPPSKNPSSGPLVPSKALNFTKNVEAPDLAGDVVTEEERRSVPFDGVVSKLYIEVPSGVKSKAGFKIIDDARGVEQFPFDQETEFAAYNDTNGFWPITFPLREGDDIVVKYINENSNVSAHLLKVWVIYVGIEALPYTLEELAERQGVEL